LGDSFSVFFNQTKNILPLFILLTILLWYAIFYGLAADRQKYCFTQKKKQKKIILKVYF